MAKLSIETITPTQAQEMLATGYANRKLSQNKIMEYALQIEKGTWSPTASKIDIDEKGKLINGNHRLQACILANKPFSTLVHRDVPTSDRDVIDTGEKRKLHDLYSMYTNKKFVINQAAYLNKCMELVTRNQFRRPRIQTLDTAKKWEAVFSEGIDWAVDTVMSGHSNKGWAGTIRNAYISGVLAFCFKRHPSKTKEFAKQILYGENISVKDPAFTIRNMILNLGDKESRNLTKTRDVPFKIMSALYAHIKEQPYAKAQISSEAWDYFLEAYDTAQVKNLLEPYVKLTLQRENDAKKLAESAKKK